MLHNATELVFSLFVPGYVLTAVLFPEGERSSDYPNESGKVDSTESKKQKSTPQATTTISGSERIILSAIFSVALTLSVRTVLGLAVESSNSPLPLLTLGGVTMTLAVVAARRRSEIPAGERYRVPYRKWLATGKDTLFSPKPRRNVALNVLLVGAVLLAASGIGYTLLVPSQGETFTEFALLTETKDGELTADDYPQEFTLGEQRQMIVWIGNEERERTRYTVISKLQEVDVTNNSLTVSRSNRLSTTEQTLDSNETHYLSQAVTPTFEGENLRLVFLLYRGQPPNTPTIDNAYRETHIWVNVTAT